MRRTYLFRILGLSILVLTGAASTAPSFAQPNLEVHCNMGCPIGAPASNDLLVREIYALSSNGNTRFADWVVYRVLPENFDGNQDRSRNFKKDPDLADGKTLSKKDYAHARAALGVDRGHQAPLATFKSNDDWAQTNFLSNITPQWTKLNQGPWKELEKAVRDLAEAHPNGTVFVMTGPLYEWPMAKLPAINKDHDVPSAYWKVVTLVENSNTTVAAFYFYQDTPRRAKYCDHMKPVDVIEEKSGLDFFSGMADQQEGAFERSPPTLIGPLGC